MFDKKDANWKKITPQKALFFTVAGVLFFTVVGFVVMFLWNNILPHVANVKPITFWQALGLFLLFKILFGGFGRRRSWKNRARGKWKKKWMNMSEEERQQFKNKWKDRCDRRASE